MKNSQKNSQKDMVWSSSLSFFGTPTKLFYQPPWTHEMQFWKKYFLDNLVFWFRLRWRRIFYLYHLRSPSLVLCLWINHFNCGNSALRSTPLVAPLKPLKDIANFFKSNLYIKDNIIGWIIFCFSPQEHHITNKAVASLLCPLEKW